MKAQVLDIRLIILLCLTIGLAPFYPEPHLFGKIAWVIGGGVGMDVTDWLDLILHGLPWVMLAVWLIFFLKMKIRKNENII